MERIFISLGSNIDAERHIRNGLNDLARAFEGVRISEVFESEAVGFDGDNFLNLVAEAYTDLPVPEVVSKLKAIETAHGRVRGAKKFAPRTLDLDLLLYGSLCCTTPVELPRPEIFHNDFVLWPLAQLWPEGRLPGRPETLAELWQHHDKHQKLWPVSFHWPE
ncbi:2-amino-4-hydroxy-6-hydroxymethyldihydropteridine diphosphokinase [Ferrimonas gelatinilytica]|uniref:2-amino-4-hydroxy-6-hydroxymethyldihydropteridine diphosphokinase n=1 Tax=Ferrimonas gelatinilytica TaxID=1255257 RepID=A0ABP9S6K8_9GAMM